MPKKHWKSIGETRFPWEREGLDFINASGSKVSSPDNGLSEASRFRSSSRWSSSPTPRSAASLKVPPPTASACATSNPRRGGLAARASWPSSAAAKVPA
jgi:hypothetical protein